jgi:hypothetical protein
MLRAFRPEASRAHYRRPCIATRPGVRKEWQINPLCVLRVLWGEKKGYVAATVNSFPFSPISKTRIFAGFVLLKLVSARCTCMVGS